MLPWKDPAVLSSLLPAPHNSCPCLPWRLNPGGVSSACRVTLNCIYLSHLGWLLFHSPSFEKAWNLRGCSQVRRQESYSFLIGARPRSREEGFPVTSC